MAAGTHWHEQRDAGRTVAASERHLTRFRPRLEALEDRAMLSTLSVLNTSNSGPHSLRAEIAAAHSGDTIAFAPSLAGKTINLTGGDLLFNKNLTLSGPGEGQLTISGNNHSRVFEVAAGTQAVMSGLTISNGFDIQGAGILNNGTLTVNEGKHDECVGIRVLCH